MKSAITPMHGMVRAHVWAEGLFVQDLRQRCGSERLDRHYGEQEMTDEPKHLATAAAALDDPYAALSQHLHGDGDDLQLETWAIEILNRTPGQWITTNTYEMRATLDRLWVKGVVEKSWIHGKNAYRISAARPRPHRSARRRPR